jgi:hypothetical protein
MQYLPEIHIQFNIRLVQILLKAYAPALLANRAIRIIIVPVTCNRGNIPRLYTACGTSGLVLAWRRCR